MPTSATRIRAGAVALAAAGVLFLAYPALRPWHDEGTVAGAVASMSSAAWVTAHFSDRSSADVSGMARHPAARPS
jgi:hypothetical protein